MLNHELTSRRWLVTKGVLFAVLAGALVLVEDAVAIRLGLLITCVWAGARFYYFLFYVLERYAGVEGRYAGIIDLCVRLWRAHKGLMVVYFACGALL